MIKKPDISSAKDSLKEGAKEYAEETAKEKAADKITDATGSKAEDVNSIVSGDKSVEDVAKQKAGEEFAQATGSKQEDIDALVNKEKSVEELAKQKAGEEFAEVTGSKTEDINALVSGEKDLKELAKDKALDEVGDKAQTAVAAASAISSFAGANKQTIETPKPSHTPSSPPSQNKPEFAAEASEGSQENTPNAEESEEENAAPPPAMGTGGKPAPLPAAIGALNILVIEGNKVGIYLRNQEGEAYSNKTYILQHGETKVEGTTDDKGYVLLDVPSDCETAEIKFWPDDEDKDYYNNFLVQIDQLKPADDPIGLQQRLSNMGVLKGNIDGDIGPITQTNIKELQYNKDLDLSGESDAPLLDWFEENNLTKD